MHGNLALLRKKKGFIMDNIRTAVLAELKAMKEYDMHVPKKAFKLAETDDLSDYDNMSISEIAELMIELAHA
jgi:hypothetical protein